MKFEIVSVTTEKVSDIGKDIQKTFDDFVEPVRVVETEAEADVLRSLNKMLVKAGKAPIKIKVKPANTNANILRRIYNFFVD